MKKFILISATILTAALYYGCEKWNHDDGNGSHGKTVADFTYTISDVATRTVVFTNKSANAEDYTWRFGDNTSSSSESPQHSYASNGNYTVSLTVSGHCGKTSSATQTIVLNPN